MRFVWTFEREAKWMVWILLIPVVLIILSLVMRFFGRMLS